MEQTLVRCSYWSSVPLGMPGVGIWDSVCVSVLYDNADCTAKMTAG